MLETLAANEKLIVPLLTFGGGFIVSELRCFFDRQHLRRSLRSELLLMYSTFQQIGQTAAGAQRKQYDGVFVRKGFEMPIFDKSRDRIGSLSDAEILHVLRAYAVAKLTNEMIARLSAPYLEKHDPYFGELVPEAEFEHLVSLVRSLLPDIESAIMELTKRLGPLLGLDNWREVSVFVQPGTPTKPRKPRKPRGG